MRGVMAWAVVAGLALGTASRACAQPAMPSLGTYALLGLDDVSVGVGARIAGGDAGANRGMVRLAAGARIEGTVAAATIRLAPGARTGGLFCNLLIARGSLACNVLAQPVVDVAALPLLQVIAGAAEVRVPAHAATAPLLAGAYGTVRVGRGGRLALAGGDYAVRSITLAPRARLTCAAACRIAVLEEVVLQPGAALEPMAPLDARAVRLDVEGHGTRAAVAIRPGATLAANVYAPQGEIRLGARGRYTGAFVGRAVRLGAAARLAGANGFAAP